jgi:hypothetical protein
MLLLRVYVEEDVLENEKCRAIRPIAILPSSHMCTLLIHVGELIYLATKAQRKYGEFEYSDVFKILERDLGHMTSLPNDEFARLTENILEVGKRKKYLWV